MMREEAELIMNSREDGLFLVRESTNYRGDYTLCVCFGGKVEHYRILHRNNRLTIDEELFFDNMVRLVEVCKFLLCFLELGFRDHIIFFR